MSNISADNNLESMEDLNITKTDNKSIKIELDKKLFNGPIFELYNYIMEDYISNNKSDELSEKSYREYQAKIEQKEQINEIKTVLFFVLYLDCHYNGEYTQFINNNRFIIAKRLVIQDYKIVEDKICFGQKRYIFIPPRKDKVYFSFIDNHNEIIIKTKKRKVISMELKGKKLQNSDDFIKQNKINIKTIEESKYIKNNNKTKSTENAFPEVDEINSNIPSDNKSMTVTDIENLSLNKYSFENYSSLTKSNKDDSDKELIGDTFYDQNSRYIFNDNYHKEIDGIFYEHKNINLNIKEKDLDAGLNELLSNNFANNNDLKSHIIFKNFMEEYIDEKEPFILEVKKSIAELLDLLNQIKNISKIMNNIQGINFNYKLPRCIIGVICGYNNSQIKLQQELFNKKYKDEIRKNHIMNIITQNKVKVVISVLKDEKILNYPLGIPDYDEKCGGQTRVDLYYMNTFFTNLDEIKIKEIYNKYSKIYQSLSLTRNPNNNNDSLKDKLNNALKEIDSLKKKLEQKEKEMEQKEKEMEKKEKEINLYKKKYGIIINQNDIIIFLIFEDVII